MPCTVFMRGGSAPAFVKEKIVGGGPQFLSEFLRILPQLSTSAELESLRRFHTNAAGENVEEILDNMATTPDQVNILANLPLQSCHTHVVQLLRKQLGMADVNSELAFDVSPHDAAKTAPAVSVLTRFKDDVAAYAHNANTAPVVKIAQLSDLDVTNYFNGDVAAEETLQAALVGVRALQKQLQLLKLSDEKMIQDTIPLLERASNWVNIDETNPDAKTSKIRFLLNRFSGQNAAIWVEFLFGALLSTKGESDLLKLNPFLPTDILDSILNLVTSSMLRANRLGHTNRCIGTVIGLESLLEKVCSVEMTLFHFVI